MSLKLIAAIGQNGQLGLKNKLPWHAPNDLAWFRNKTTGSVLIVGARTFSSLPHLPQRIVVRHDPQDDPLVTLQQVNRQWHGWPTWIAGGEATYRAFARYVTELHLSPIDYDGPADTFFPFDAFTPRQRGGVRWRSIPPQSILDHMKREYSDA